MQNLGSKCNAKKIRKTAEMDPRREPKSENSGINVKRNGLNFVGGLGLAAGWPGVGRGTPGDGFSTPLFIHLNRNLKPTGWEKQDDSHQSRRRAESAVADMNALI